MRDLLTRYEKEKLKEVHRHFDEDGDGKLTRSELIKAMGTKGYVIQRPRVAQNHALFLVEVQSPII